ncbi:MAG: hypothetical protein PHQ12_04755 [Chthoniobacteraceae bacterium]|nr:hypothetical protein [Chthoniobacteraceae bacterium]
MSAPICHVRKMTASAGTDCMVALNIQLDGAAEFLFLIPAEDVPHLAAGLLFAAREAAAISVKKTGGEAQ